MFDDCVNEFRGLAKTCDGFVFGSPVHYAAMGAAMTAFMDRLFYSDALRKRQSDFLYEACGVCALRTPRGDNGGL